jgi:hypothetical protein
MQVMGKERMRAGFGSGLRGSGKFEGECEGVLYACLWFHPMFFSWAIELFFWSTSRDFWWVLVLLKLTLQVVF